MPTSLDEPHPLDRYLPRADHDLRRLASLLIRRWRPPSAFRTTSIVNDTFVRLASRGDTPIACPDHFLSLAARAMRQVLVDRERRRLALRRGAGGRPVPLHDSLAVPHDPGESPDVLDVDAALRRLAEHDPRKAKVVELRFFGGLDVTDVARLLRVSRATVARDWAFAKVWLMREMREMRDDAERRS